MAEQAVLSLPLFGPLPPASVEAVAATVGPQNDLRITIPGDPVAQGRGKASRWKARDGRSGLTVRDPEKSRSWKAYAAGVYVAALRAAGRDAPWFVAGEPVVLELLFVFRCPASDHRKRAPMRRRWKVGERLDCDNLAKAVMDAANGILWLDDGQVVELRVRKVIGTQAEPSRVELVARRAEATP